MEFYLTDKGGSDSGIFPNENSGASQILISSSLVIGVALVSTEGAGLMIAIGASTGGVLSIVMGEFIGGIVVGEVVVSEVAPSGLPKLSGELPKKGADGGWGLPKIVVAGVSGIAGVGILGVGVDGVEPNVEIEAVDAAGVGSVVEELPKGGCATVPNIDGVVVVG